MDTDDFSEPLTALYDRLRTLSQTLEQRATSLGLPLDRLMEDLSTALEELRVADETLRQQHQVLAEAHYTIATEQQRYHDLFAYAPDGYLVTNEAGVITDANRAAAALLTIRQNRLIGKPLAVFVAKDEQPALWACRAALGRLAAGVSHEIRNPLAAVFLHVDLLEEEFRQPSSDSAVQSTPGHGTTFTITLPVEPPLQADAPG
jgi:signal transduction histidine kinase